MENILLRPAEPDRDFGQLAAWFNFIEDTPNSETGLKDYYEREKGRILTRVAEDSRQGLLGFYWLEQDRVMPDRDSFSMFVNPVRRGQGVGGHLYSDMLDRVTDAKVKSLLVEVRDDCPEGLVFVQHRGFKERSHLIAMALDLITFDDQLYEAEIVRLKDEGFLFTSMEELGNSEEAQRRLYALNNSTVMDTQGASGEPAWNTFEDFQQQVCQRPWFVPAGQKVVIDSASGEWAAMSAITVFEGANYAYNLFTGVDRRYRGRKLGQAVKVQALRFARDVLKVNSVHTHHNTKNPPILAIDRKFGYVQIPGYYSMEKQLAAQ